jgi:hypothetical protein
MDQQLDKKTFDYLAILTGIVVLVYLGAGIFSLVHGKISWEIYSAAFGGPTTMLLGYWVRGKQA